ncbi:transposase [Streptomyces sp. NPDC001792]|uniref:transposase n=1 Tax=Streptomyces sp. NPDC001792 TaxID=3154524 RepID=UPI00331758C7
MWCCAPAGRWSRCRSCRWRRCTGAGTGRCTTRSPRAHIAVSRLRMALAGLELPRGADRQLSIALDVTPWPRPDAECSPQRLHCHRPCCCDGVRQTIPGWPYQVAAALGGGRSSWTGPLDAIGVPANQIRELHARLEQAGQWRPGDPPVLFAMDSGYDLVR